MKNRSSKRLIGACLSVFALLVILLSDFIAFPSMHKCNAPILNTGSNGIWLRYKWYFGEHSNNELTKMCTHLREDQIRYAYFHVRHITKTGALKFHKMESARKRLASVRAQAPSSKLIAWIYVSSTFVPEAVDISSKSVRTKMIDEAKWLVNECGFDGVQWDYEFANNGNQDLCALLAETKAQLPSNSIVSCATPMWYPFILWGWSDSHFQQICANCDQVAVMCYDSFFYLPRAYAWLLSEQCNHVLADAAAANKNCRVLLGVPSYDVGTVGHLNQPENLRVALPAVREGLSKFQANRNSFDGVAIFAEYTTDEFEWQDYRHLWLGK